MELVLVVDNSLYRNLGDFYKVRSFCSDIVNNVNAVSMQTKVPRLNLKINSRLSYLFGKFVGDNHVYPLAHRRS